jgi:hypothetical protein
VIVVTEQQATIKIEWTKTKLATNVKPCKTTILEVGSNKHRREGFAIRSLIVFTESISINICSIKKEWRIKKDILVLK